MPGKIPPFRLKLVMAPMITRKNIRITGFRQEKTGGANQRILPQRCLNNPINTSSQQASLFIILSFIPRCRKAYKSLAPQAFSHFVNHSSEWSATLTFKKILGYRTACLCIFLQRSLKRFSTTGYRPDLSASNSRIFPKNLFATTYL